MHCARCSRIASRRRVAASITLSATARFSCIVSSRSFFLRAETALRDMRNTGQQAIADRKSRGASPVRTWLAAHADHIDASTRQLLLRGGKMRHQASPAVFAAPLGSQGCAERAPPLLREPQTWRRGTASAPYRSRTTACAQARPSTFHTLSPVPLCAAHPGLLNLRVDDGSVQCGVAARPTRPHLRSSPCS